MPLNIVRIIIHYSNIVVYFCISPLFQKNEENVRIKNAKILNEKNSLLVEGVYVFWHKAQNWMLRFRHDSHIV